MNINKVIHFIIINFLTINLVLAVSDKPVDEDALFIKNDKNIKNKKTRNELTLLKQEFDSKRSKIKIFYEKEMEILRQKKQNELKALRKEFKERRDELLENNKRKTKKSNKKNQRSIIKSKN